MKNVNLIAGLLSFGCFVMQMEAGFSCEVDHRQNEQSALPSINEWNILFFESSTSPKNNPFRDETHSDQVCPDSMLLRLASGPSEGLEFVNVQDGKLNPEASTSPMRLTSGSSEGLESLNAQYGKLLKEASTSPMNVVGSQPLQHILNEKEERLKAANQYVKATEPRMGNLWKESTEHKNYKNRAIDLKESIVKVKKAMLIKEKIIRKSRIVAFQQKHAAKRVLASYRSYNKARKSKATAVQAMFRGHKARREIALLKEKAFLANTIGWLGGATRAEDLPKDSREARLVGWTRNSYNVFNQTESTYDKMAADYRLVRSKLNADQYGVLYDLAVSHRAHTNLSDSHADNNWIIEASRMGSDNLPGAVKLVRRCTEALKGADVPKDDVLKAISDMAADTLVTGGRVGIDLHRQATEDEMRIMLPALRLRGERALAEAANNIENALSELTRIFLDAAFRQENSASPHRKAVYDKDLFDSHKAHCFIAAARGVGDWNDIEQQVSDKLTDRGMTRMTQAYIKSTKEYYDRLDS